MIKNKKNIPLKLVKSRTPKSNINFNNNSKLNIKNLKSKKNLYYQPIYNTLLSEEIKKQFNVKIGSLSKVDDEVCDVNTRAHIKDANLNASYNLTMGQLKNDYDFIIKYANNEILESWVDNYYPILNVDEKVDIIFRKKLGGIISPIDLQSISINTNLIKRNPIITGILKTDFLSIFKNNKAVSESTEQTFPPDIDNNIIQPITITQGPQIVVGVPTTIKNPDYNFEKETLHTNWYSNFNKDKKYFFISISSPNIKNITYEIIYNDELSYKYTVHNSSGEKIIDDNVGIFFDNREGIFSLFVQKDSLSEIQDNEEILFTVPRVISYEEYYEYLYYYNFLLNGEMFQTVDGGETYTSKMMFKNTDKNFAYKIDKTVNEVREYDEFYITFSHISKNTSIHELVKNILIYDITDCI